jgi:hypothetical protein
MHESVQWEVRFSPSSLSTVSIRLSASLATHAVVEPPKAPPSAPSPPPDSLASSNVLRAANTVAANDSPSNVEVEDEGWAKTLSELTKQHQAHLPATVELQGLQKKSRSGNLQRRTEEELENGRRTFPSLLILFFHLTPGDSFDLRCSSRCIVANRGLRRFLSSFIQTACGSTRHSTV